MSEAIRDFTNFLSAEEENILKSFINLRDDAFLVMNLDILFQSCLSLQPIDKKELKIPAFLYLNVHREFYLAMASFLRLHLSKSFASLRSSLDSVFTSSYLLKNLDKIKIYLSPVSQDQAPEEKKEWDNIFKNIKKTIKINIPEYPNFKNLLEIHEFCSVYLHSDALCVMQRFDVKSRLF